MWSPRSKTQVRDRLTGLSNARSSSRAHQPHSSATEIQAPRAERRGQSLRGDVDDPGNSDVDDRGNRGGNDPGERRFFFAWDPRARKAALALIAALAVIVAWWWFSGQPKELTPVDVDVTSGVAVTTDKDSAPVRDESQTVIVHVVGKVASPGVVELPAGARVLDAVEAAGGVTKSKALESVNLARIVVDGEQIDVGASAEANGGSSRVSLNSASAEQLQQLPGVGPVIAERIVAWRTKNGPFRSVAELAEVSGIGPAMVEQIEGQVGM